MRLIDADALKTPIEDRIDNIPASEYDNGWNNAIYAVIDEIDNAPTVETKKLAYNEGFKDGVEQGIKLSKTPQGEWIGNAFDEHHCNRCGHPALWEEEPDGYYEVQSRFCPNCGLPMRYRAEND